MFFGGNFQLWKLHTAADYLSFFLFLLAGIAVFVVAAKCMNRRRNHETAVNKVMKRLGKLGKKPSRVYKNVTLKTEDGGQSLDGIVLDRGGPTGGGQRSTESPTAKCGGGKTRNERKSLRIRCLSSMRLRSS